MKYAFIVNPASGQGKKKALIEELKEFIEASSKDIKLYYTAGEKDATVLAGAIAKEAGDEQVVIFACGGDGTIQEVANGIVGHNNAVLGVIPVGSGNDFVRTLGGGLDEGQKFLDLDRQVNGEMIKADLIKMSYVENGETVDKYIVNGINIGFDGNAAITAHKAKNYPLISGTMSYIVGVAVNLAGKKGENLRITADGREVHVGPLLLATLGNGAFCGGGFESCPYADIYDGLGELLIVNDIKRREFIHLVPKYKAGKIFEVPGIEKLTKYARAEVITIEPLAAPTMQFVADGEIYETGAIKLEMVKQAIWVMLPAED